MLRTKLPFPLGEGQNQISRTRPIKSGEGLNLYIARINRLARKRQIQDAIYNGLACVVTGYLSMLFAYWLFSYPTIYMGFANIANRNYESCSQIRS